MPVGEGNAAPRGSTTIALVVPSVPYYLRAALRYVEKLPAAARLRLCVPPGESEPFTLAARDRGVRSRAFRSAVAAACKANIVVVFGACPFTAEEMVALASRGIPVEMDEAQHANRRMRRHGLC